MTCGKCGATEKVAHFTYKDLKTGKVSRVERCESCLEAGLRTSKPAAADELMKFMRRFAYSTY